MIREKTVVLRSLPNGQFIPRKLRETTVYVMVLDGYDGPNHCPGLISIGFSRKSKYELIIYTFESIFNSVFCEMALIQNFNEQSAKMSRREL
jgi:hypothetical protein